MTTEYNKRDYYLSDQWGKEEQDDAVINFDKCSFMDKEDEYMIKSFLITFN